MAKENLVILHGQIIKPVQVYSTTNGDLFKGQFAMQVIRRPRTSSGEFTTNIKFDCPVVMTRNEDLIKQMAQFKQGDMVDVRGVLSTREVIRSAICPHCNKENKWPGNAVYITPIYMCRREQEISNEEAMKLLKERSEISNLCMLIGTLCRDVSYYKDEKKRSYAEYQLAVNRKYRIIEDPETTKTDYPWIKVFGKQALKDTECLSTNSTVYISGAIQTREIDKTNVCEFCGGKYKLEDEKATEIVPYSTEYLANCKEPEVEEELLSSELEVVPNEEEA